MEPLKEPISVRVARINSRITGKSQDKEKCNILNREALLDTLQALYDECTLENLQKSDPNIAQFAEKYKQSISEIKQLRVNVKDFDVKDVIGRGHFGDVHVVKERQTGDVYAMKTLRKSGNEIKSTNFEEERFIMAYGHSPWLTSLQYAFQDNSYLYLVMEYHPGGDLFGLLNREGGTLPESAATFYLAELVLALEDLHQMGFVHRDIKPDNLLLDRCGHLKLADFGSAAKLNHEGLVTEGPPVGTPDYIAPEVLRSLETRKNEKNAGYGICCDFWSLGVLAYELTIGQTPFTGQNTTAIYAKIMNHQNHFKLPPDVTLTQAYANFIKCLITDQKTRLNKPQIKGHPVFKNTRFDTLLTEVPPYVPKITSAEDTSNFTDVQGIKRTPSVENFKKRTQFSGRNLPFVGFTFTHDPEEHEAPYEKMVIKNETVQNLRSEVHSLQKKLMRNEEDLLERGSIERKLEEKVRKIDSLESLRDKLEREMANCMAESTALKRTLELERKDRVELERKALDLIKAAKIKWELTQKSQIESLSKRLEEYKDRVGLLTNSNNTLKEQLKCALQMEGKHKESLEKVQNLSRRSVVGLESRLEKITSETQNKIHDLQSKLSDELLQKNALESQLTQLKNKNLELVEKLEVEDRNYRSLKEKMDQAEDIIGSLSNKVNDLAEEMTQMESYRAEIESLQRKVNENLKTIKDLENKNTMLKMETQSLEKLKKDFEEQTVLSNKKIREIESQLEEEKSKTESLSKQIKEVEVVSESQELRELRTKYWRMEKEFGNCKIDKRILERELKDAQNEIKSLNDTIAGFNDKLAENKKNHESALLELSNINESLTLELMKAKDSYKNLQDKLENERKKSDDEETIITELKQIINNSNEKITQLNKDLQDTQSQKTNLETHLQNAEKEKSRLMDLVDQLQREKAEIFNNLEKAHRELKNTNLNMEALKEACSLLEHQVIEFEKIVKNFEAKDKTNKTNTEKLIQDVFKAKSEVQEAKKLYNEEKSLKLLADTKIKRLNEDIECLQNECKSYKEQCMEYKQYSTNLSDELTCAEEKITDLEMATKNLERKNGELIAENKMLKEEISQHLTKIHSVKEHCYKLNHQVRDLQENKNMLMQQLQELERIFTEKMNYYKERELKSDSTIRQQIKLIDYLQTKIDENSHKKRTISEKLFGSSKKENIPPILAMNYKDLESELNKERQLNKILQEEIHRLKSEQASNLREIASSPSNLIRQSSSRRMHHNIPHRFESKLCTKPVKCAHCANNVVIGRHFNCCSECNIQVHTNCASLVPRTCGLPRAFAEHFRESLSKLNDEKAVCDTVGVEGWVKVPNKDNGWGKVYACLFSDWLKVYTAPPTEQGSRLVQTFELKPKDSTGKVILEPLASEVGVQVANSDLPFVLKIEVSSVTTCWPSRCFILMTLSAQQTDQWYQALQNIFGVEQEITETIATIPDGISVNCIMDLSESIRLLGTNKGLYSYYNGVFLHIEGLNSVHQFGILHSNNVVIMIVNSKNCLIYCDLNHLINLTQCASCTKPTLKYKPVKINNLHGFHLLQVSNHFRVQKIAVATAKQLIILMYNLELGEFIPERILDTAEPTSCILFTENSVIVGADKYFEIDLSTYEADEFLDISDSNLKPAVTCYKMKSFPMAILEVNKNPREYLLCFSEFCVFVDEYGRSSRDDCLKGQYLPTAFHFVKPFVFMVEFNGVEVVKVIEKMGESVRYPLDKINYLGCNKRGIYLLQGKTIKYMDVKVLGEGNESLISENTESERFSFTSSMVNSLDGEETSDSEKRRVTFTESEL